MSTSAKQKAAATPTTTKAMIDGVPAYHSFVGLVKNGVRIEAQFKRARPAQRMDDGKRVTVTHETYSKSELEPLLLSLMALKHTTKGQDLKDVNTQFDVLFAGYERLGGRAAHLVSKAAEAEAAQPKATRKSGASARPA